MAIKHCHFWKAEKIVTRNKRWRKCVGEQLIYTMHFEYYIFFYCTNILIILEESMGNKVLHNLPLDLFVP